MKIITLIENTTCREDLACEHGLSLYIETGDKKILFDAGQSGAFADNAEKLGVDLTQVDFAVLSHGHYDHCGGLRRFLEINRTAPVYVSRDALEPHYNAAGKDIGLDPFLRKTRRLIFVEDVLELGEGITLYPAREEQLCRPIDRDGMTVVRDGVRMREDFSHEQYLVIQHQETRICFSGCSHRGILNIARYFQPDILVGGFHFMKKKTTGDDGRMMELTAQIMMTESEHTVYYTGHCTGEAQFDLMKTVMGEKLHSLSTGNVFVL